MKTKVFLVLLAVLVSFGAVPSEARIGAPKDKVSFSLHVPKDSAEGLQPGQRVTIEASHGQKGKYDPAPAVQGAIVLDGLVLDVGKIVLKDGSVNLVIAVNPSEAQN